MFIMHIYLIRKKRIFRQMSFKVIFISAYKDVFVHTIQIYACKLLPLCPY